MLSSSGIQQHHGIKVLLRRILLGKWRPIDILRRKLMASKAEFVRFLKINDIKDLRFLFVHWLISQEFFMYKKNFCYSGRTYLCIVLE
jgi:hypothetical protein